MDEAQVHAGDAPSRSPAPVPRSGKRRRFLALLLLVVLLAAAGAGAWYFLDGRWYESTDDAYVSGNVVQITPRIAGTVVAIAADDNDRVQSGQLLVRLDAADADIALAQTKAALGQAVRRVSGLFSTAKTSAAQVQVSEAALEQARADYARRQSLARTGAISSEEMAHARDALASAGSALAAVRAQLLTARAQTEGTSVATHPDVLAAAANVRAAWLDDQRTVIPAPVDGWVAQRAVQLGQHVQPGTPLMAVVPLERVWVDANFKETQLARMRIGQPVTLTADLYGDSVRYQGHVAGLGIGTGSAFSLLPAQNATGNWIKIVQRLPVRIVLDDGQLQQHPLRIGLSMAVRVDLRDGSGAALAPAAAPQDALRTAVFQTDTAAIDAEIANIIAQNSGGAELLDGTAARKP